MELAYEITHIVRKMKNPQQSSPPVDLHQVGEQILEEMRFRLHINGTDADYATQLSEAQNRVEKRVSQARAARKKTEVVERMKSALNRMAWSLHDSMNTSEIETLGEGLIELENLRRKWESLVDGGSSENGKGSSADVRSEHPPQWSQY